MELVEGPASKKVCAQCNREKDLEEFYRTKNGRDGRMKLCAECHRGNLRASQEESRRRWEQWERERAEKERLERERQQEIEQAERERKERLLRERQALIEQEPERQCSSCKRRFPLTHFMFDPYDPLTPVPLKHQLYYNYPLQRCPECHAAMRDARLQPCCLCQQAVRHPLHEFDGYRIDRDGLTLIICCESCLPAFLASPRAKQRFYIQSRCKQHYRSGQLIYTQTDPRTQEVRYVGRTYHMLRRQREHLQDSSPYDPTEIRPGIKPSYTRAHWTYDLLQLKLAPQAVEIYHVEVSARVVEWEQRYIWHYIRQGAPLLNTQARDERLCKRIHATKLDFLTAPFEALIEEGFFAPDHIEAFIHKWHT